MQGEIAGQVGADHNPLMLDSGSSQAPPASDVKATTFTLPPQMMHRRVSDERRNFNTEAFVRARVNTAVSSRFKLDDREIGKGAFGKVFVAEDRDIPGRRVAIKRVVVTDQARKALFQREALIMRKLDHPSICRLLETFDEGRIMYLVMELCEGGEVFDRITNEGRIEEHVTAGIIKQVAGALKHAHARGIAHRDLKPENCCFCSKDPKDDRIKVIDWGVAFCFGRTAMRSGVGSVMYAAPEVLDRRGSRVYSQSCDLWSLGVMSYVMLSGKPPFWGSPSVQLERMKAESFPMHDKTWQATSAEAKDFITKLLKADPAKRLAEDQMLAHPWLRITPRHVDAVVTQQVLSNLRNFTRASHFFSICAASVARQLDDQRLQNVREVFNEMDTNGDGMLQLIEVREGFAKIFGENSEIVQEVEEMFLRLDLDGSGAIDYMEFCAAGLDELIGKEEGSLRAAFRAFDVVEDGHVTKKEMEEVLTAAGTAQGWSTNTVQEVTCDIFERFDLDGDGSIDFKEWLQLVEELRKPAQTEDGKVTAKLALGAVEAALSSTVAVPPATAGAGEENHPTLLGHLSPRAAKPSEPLSPVAASSNIEGVGSVAL